ncbi:MAG: hypothetical protein BWY74_02308 [Firmicutes bacterium ADurb.Bin419]|nr:MAG: hypothetical protein BWY74_02308 [Firmicutes bacterium ADurb.Bin419]
MGEEINKLADAYNVEMWNNFANCFKVVEVQGDILKKVPQDIVNVIVGLLGYEQAKRWVLEEIPDLDNYSVINLVANETGIKAVRMFVLTMPN